MIEISTATKFNNWVRTAPAGQEVLYHTGHLTRDRNHIVPASQRGGIVLALGPREPIDSLADAAYAAYERGAVELYQVRFKPGVFQYFARRRPRRV